MKMICPKSEKCNMRDSPNHCQPHEETGGCFSESWGCPICIPYKEEKVEYELLKPISIKAMEEAGACERELHRFCFLLHKLYPEARHCYIDEFNVRAALKIASQCEGGIQWLLDKGFIREKEPELLPCPACKAVNIFLYQPTCHTVCCNSCGMTGPHKATKSEAHQSWNELPR